MYGRHARRDMRGGDGTPSVLALLLIHPTKVKESGRRPPTACTNEDCDGQPPSFLGYAVLEHQHTSAAPSVGCCCHRYHLLLIRRTEVQQLLDDLGHV